jgi:hypothetical protein
LTSPLLAVNTANGRFYVNPQNQKEVPSITNIIGMKDKPALKYWAAKQAALFAAQNVEVIGQLKTEQERVDLIKGAPFRSTGNASQIGNQVHDWIDGFVKHFIATGKRDWQPEEFDSASLTARRMWKQFLHCDNHYQIQWLVSEFTVWSDKHEYAGTGDWIAKIGGAVVYGDTKTGNNVYSEVGLQVSAAGGADYALDGNGEQYDLPEAERFAVLHIRPTYTRMSPLNGIPGCFRAFLGLRAVFDWHCNESENVIGYAPQLKGER